MHRCHPAARQNRKACWSEPRLWRSLVSSLDVTRYDQRKNLEEAEANAIGTAYVRAEFLPAEDAARARELLRRYVDQRVAFYLARDEGQVGQINADTEKLHAELWSAIVRNVTPQQTAVEASWFRA
jgi:hypothetical protein